LRRENRSLAANLSKSHSARAQSPHEITRAASTQRSAKQKPGESESIYLYNTFNKRERGHGKRKRRDTAARRATENGQRPNVEIIEIRRVSNTQR